jgi:hypothetical protein
MSGRLWTTCHTALTSHQVVSISLDPWRSTWLFNWRWHATPCHFLAKGAWRRVLPYQDRSLGITVGQILWWLCGKVMCTEVLLYVTHASMYPSQRRACYLIFQNILIIFTFMITHHCQKHSDLAQISSMYIQRVSVFWEVSWMTIYKCIWL